MDARGIEPEEIVPASRKYGEKEAKELVRAVDRIVVAKGRKVTEHPGGRARAEVVAALLGPTGNLRAPTIRSGDQLLVGFDQDAYARILD